jgi:hypothetical protein
MLGALLYFERCIRLGEVRQFKLWNSDGKNYDLLDPKGIMLFSVAGLGRTEEAEYYRLDEHFRILNSKNSQREISGTLLMPGNTVDDMYKKYYDFMRFAARTPLTIEYTTFDTFYIDVHLVTIEKTEVSPTYNALECPVTFRALGPSYRKIQVYATSSKELVSTPYDYTYEDTYSTTDAILNLSIKSDSMYASPCRLYISGPVIDPVWQQYLNSSLIATGSMNGTIPEGHKLVIDTVALPNRIYEVDSSGAVVADRYSLCDYTTDRFLYIYEGTNMISVAHKGDKIPYLTAEVRLEYDSV